MATFTAKGQIVIPRKFRIQYDIKPGTRAAVIATAEGILLKPITRAYIRRLRGAFKGEGVLKVMMDDRKREREL